MYNLDRIAEMDCRTHELSFVGRHLVSQRGPNLVLCCFFAYRYVILLASDARMAIMWYINSGYFVTQKPLKDFMKC